jgi:hypothetical protein
MATVFSGLRPSSVIQPTAFAAAILLTLISPLAAQTVAPPDPASVPLRLGPVLVNPRLALTNLGVDTNVFNEPDAEGPESDLTLTLTPSAEVWLPMGPTWVFGTIREDIVWFKEFVSERSLNNLLRAGWLVPLNRLTFDVATGWTHTRERPGYEIDARAERHERDLTGSAELRAFPQTRFGVRGERRRIAFEEGETFMGVDLREELSRTTTAFAIVARHELTPLTTLVFNLAREQDRFLFSPLRDSDTGRFEAGLEFDPDALISGTARIGYRDFDPADDDVPGYSGLTAAANVTYIALDAIRFGFQAMRDVEYSYDETQPYYLQTGFTGSLTVQVYGPVDAEGRFGRQNLSYRMRGDVDAEGDRVDRVRTYGGGVGYRLGRDLRIGFNIDHYERTSEVAVRAYDGLRYGVSVTYGR